MGWSSATNTRTRSDLLALKPPPGSRRYGHRPLHAGPRLTHRQQKGECHRAVGTASSKGQKEVGAPRLGMDWRGAPGLIVWLAARYPAPAINQCGERLYPSSSGTRHRAIPRSEGFEDDPATLRSVEIAPPIGGATPRWEPNCPTRGRRIGWSASLCGVREDGHRRVAAVQRDHGSGGMRGR